MEKKLVIENANQCMEIINAVIDKSYPEEKKKYASYLSLAYFTKNIHLFDKKDIKKILDNEELSLSISSKSSYDLLENAVKNKKIFTTYSKRWFINVKINQQVLRQYLEILLNEDDTQQIKDFCNANQELTKKYFLHGDTTNYMFEKYVIASNPGFIVHRKKLLEKDIIELINEGLITYKDCKTVLSQYSYQLQTLVTKKEVKEILSYDFTESKKYEILEMLKENPVFFIKKIKEHDNEFIKKLLDTPGIVNVLYLPRKKVNFLQDIVENESNKKEDTNIRELLTIVFHEYKEILLKDIVKMIGAFDYQHKNSYLLSLYEEKQFNVLKELCYFNKELTEKQNDIILNATFDCIIMNYNTNDENNNKNENNYQEIHKMMKPLLSFQYELLLAKVEEIKDKKLCDESFIFQIEKFVLHNKLSEKLVEKNSKGKQLKI